MLIYISFLTRDMACEIVAPIHFTVILHRIRNFASVQFTYVDAFYKSFKHTMRCIESAIGGGAGGTPPQSQGWGHHMLCPHPQLRHLRGLQNATILSFTCKNPLSAGATPRPHKNFIQNSSFRERRMRIRKLGRHAHCSRLQHHVQIVQIGGRAGRPGAVGDTGTQSQGWGHHMLCPPPQLQHIGPQDAKISRLTCKNPLATGATP